MKTKMWFVGLLAVLMVYVTAQGALAAVTGCLNAYTYNDTGNATHVSVGNVCINATLYDVNPTAAVKCGQWSNCVAGATTAPQYYVGYAASGTACVDTGWASAGSSVDYGTIRVRTTEHVDTCSVIGYSASYDKGDFQNIVVDGLGTAGAETVDWLDIVVLLVILGFLVGIAVNMKKLGK